MDKKKILYLSPHDFYPAMNGGQIRIYHILKGLSLEFEITVVYFSPSEGNQEIVSVHMPQIRFYQIKPVDIQKLSFTEKLKLKIKLRSFRNTGSLAFGLAKIVANRISYESFDLLFFEHLESLNAAGRYSKKLYPKALRIINLHNIDHELWESEYKSYPANKHLLVYSKRALQFERQLFKNVDLALVCSKTDEEKIQLLNKMQLKTLVVQNGTVIPKEKVALEKIKNSLLFVGALDYFPNIEGLKWFYNEIWPLLKLNFQDLRLFIVGRGEHSHLRFIDDLNIYIVGEVENVALSYYQSMISIVPLKHGSGTRLKIPEAMAHGVPVVSTGKGAEGNQYTHQVNIMLADSPQEFANCVKELLENKKLYEKIKSNAFEWMKDRLDWEVISKKLTIELKAIK